MLPWLETKAFGEALDTGKLEQLRRYAVHRNRELERMPVMLLRPKDLRAKDAYDALSSTI